MYSTFAWYKAANSANIDVTTTGSSLESKASTVSIDDIAVTLSIAGDASVELSYFDGTNVYVGAYANGNYATNAWETSKIGTWSATASATPSPAQKSAVAGKNYTIVTGSIVANGNVALVTNDGKTAASPTITIYFDGNGDVVANATETNNTFTIRTNNPVGLEAWDYKAGESYAVGDPVFNDGTLYTCTAEVASSTTWGADSSSFTEVTASAAANTAKGSFVKSSSNYYVALVDNAGADATATTKYYQVISHSLDGITVTQNNISNNP